MLSLDDSLRDHVQPENAFIYFLERAAINESRTLPLVEIRRQMRHHGYSTSEIFFAEELLRGAGTIEDFKQVNDSIPYDAVSIKDSHRPAYAGIVPFFEEMFGFGLNPTT